MPRGIANGDLCRLYNDRGEAFGHALIVEGLLPGVVGAQKQLQGSKMLNGVNINALTSQDTADMGGGPVFYSTLAELERVTDPGRIAPDPEIHSAKPASA